LSELAILIRRGAMRQLKKITPLTYVFRFNRTKIEEYMRKVKAEIEEPLPKFPDIKKYLKEQEGS